MFVLVLAAENDETRQTVSFLIILLVGIAAALSALTIWYWLYTDPKRRRDSSGAGSMESLLVDGPGHTDEVVSVDVEGRAAPASTTVADEVAAPIDTRPEPKAEPHSASAGTSAGQDRVAVDVAAVAAPAPADDFVTGPLRARQTWDFVAAAKQAENRNARPPSVVPLVPSQPRIAVPKRGGSATPRVDEDADDPDELAVVRRRREREAARGISDEVWQSVQRSVFDKLDS